MSKRVSFDRQTDKAILVSSKRNYGIDLLRILSMLMIPILHVLGHGGMLREAEPLSIRYELLWFVEVACYGAVDIYAIISGYVGYGKSTKYSNLLYLCFQVLFYSVGITVVTMILYPELIGAKQLLTSFLIISRSNYWYFSSYFCLFFFMPILNWLINNESKKNIEHLIITSFFVFSFLPTITHSDFGNNNGGCSFLWLTLLYIVGAYFSKYNVSRASKKKYIMGYIICVCFTWLFRIPIDLATIKIFGEPKGNGLLIGYVSPTIVFSAAFLVLYFSKLNLGKYVIAFIKFFAPVSFGVYLFHLHPVIWNYVIKDAFISYLKLNPLLMLLAIIGTAMFIWLFGSLVDRVRLILFDWLHVKQLCEWIEKKLRQAFCKIEKKVDAKYSIVE